MTLTQETLKAAYEYLRSTRPFCRWKLPHADAIEFAVISDASLYGYCEVLSGKPIRVAVSRRTVRSNFMLIETMAHEMIHAYLDVRDARTQHGPRFKKAALQVCKHHGFNPLTF